MIKKRAFILVLLLLMSASIFCGVEEEGPVYVGNMQTTITGFDKYPDEEFCLVSAIEHTYIFRIERITSNTLITTLKSTETNYITWSPYIANLKLNKYGSYDLFDGSVDEKDLLRIGQDIESNLKSMAVKIPFKKGLNSITMGEILKSDSNQASMYKLVIKRTGGEKIRDSIISIMDEFTFVSHFTLKPLGDESQGMTFLILYLILSSIISFFIQYLLFEPVCHKSAKQQQWRMLSICACTSMMFILSIWTFFPYFIYFESPQFIYVSTYMPILFGLITVLLESLVMNRYLKISLSKALFLSAISVIALFPTGLLLYTFII